MQGEASIAAIATVDMDLQLEASQAAKVPDRIAAGTRESTSIAKPGVDTGCIEALPSCIMEHPSCIMEELANTAGTMAKPFIADRTAITFLFYY